MRISISKRKQSFYHTFILVPPPSPTPSPLQCGPNEIIDDNPIICNPKDLTCEMLFRGESQECLSEKSSSPICTCIPGFVRNADEECVPPQKC